MNTINQKIAEKDLFEVVSVLNENNIFYSAIFGTLLGIIRDKNFINGDTDIDLALLNEQKDLFLSLLDVFKERGFRIYRQEEHLISLIRDGVYLDFYFFKKIKNKRVCAFYKFRKDLIEYVCDCSFLGGDVKIPISYEKIFLQVYGRTWRIPIKGKGACPLDRRILNVLIRLTPMKIRKLVKGFIK